MAARLGMEDGSSPEERGWQLASAWMMAARLGDDGSSPQRGWWQLASVWMMAARLRVDDGSSPRRG